MRRTWLVSPRRQRHRARRRMGSIHATPRCCCCRARLTRGGSWRRTWSSGAATRGLTPAAGEAARAAAGAGEMEERLRPPASVVGLYKLNPVHGLKGARFQPLSLCSDILVSKHAFKLNLYRYSVLAASATRRGTPSPTPRRRWRRRSPACPCSPRWAKTTSPPRTPATRARPSRCGSRRRRRSCGGARGGCRRAGAYHLLTIVHVFKLHLSCFKASLLPLKESDHVSCR
jgi:hypothetical protein